MNCKAVFCSLTAALLIYGFPAEGGQKTEKHRGVKKVTVATPEEDDYDVDYVKMEISATNTSTAISGHVTTRAKVVAATMQDYYFELSNQLTIDSAIVDGQLLPVVAVNNFVRKITLPAPLAQNSVFTAEVFYQGVPTGGTGFFTNGILHQSQGINQVTHTVSAAVHSRDWWPCKQSLTDKIDSADMWITVPTGLNVGSNGLLRNITPLGGGLTRYEWAERYPADYYLLSFAVSSYTEYNYYMHFTGSSDSMLIQNFVYNDTVALQQQDQLDTIGLIIDYFSSVYSRYPFDKEKAGICQTPLGGGMENQTLVSVGSFESTLIAHELSHQWWGDNVTCRSLKDMWLNEGWATYSEHLFVEHFRGALAAKNYRTGQFYAVINGPGSTGGSVYVSDTTNEFRIYDGRLTYYKGAAVAHMLRYMINNDSLFFELLRGYQQQYKAGNATTEELKLLAEQVSGVDLDTFFTQWVYKEGYPTYAAKWYQDGGNQVVIRLSQTTSKPTSVSLFKLPVEIKLTSSQGDTVIRVSNDQAVQYYSFAWNKPMDSLIIDPENNILNKVGAVTRDSSILSVPAALRQQIEIYPNPSATAWQVKNVPLRSTLQLHDAAGRKMWETTAVTDSVSVPAAPLVPGTYILTVIGENRLPLNYQLVR